MFLLNYECEARRNINYLLIIRNLFSPYLIAFCFILYLGNGKAIAQEQIRGRVFDSDYKLISGVTVKLKNSNVGTQTDSKGGFAVKYTSLDDVLVFTAIGYKRKETTVRRIKYNSIVELESSADHIDEVSVSANRSVKVDLENKRHMSLAQVLEGNVPGLQVRRASTTSETGRIGASNRGGFNEIQFNREVYEELSAGRMPAGWSSSGSQSFPLINAIKSKGLNTYEKFMDFVQSPDYVQLINDYQDDASGVPPIRVNRTTSNDGLILEMNGVSNFENLNKNGGMLFVIDGIPFDEFPKDYPMSNVDKLEVLTDPKECIRWGTRGLGGVVLITSKKALSRKLAIDYSSNLYFTPKVDRSASAFGKSYYYTDYLDYLKEMYDRKLYNFNDAKILETRDISEASKVLANLALKKLDNTQFNTIWDSLGNLTYRDIQSYVDKSQFTQNHTLGIGAGGKNVSYRIAGTFSDKKFEQLNSGSKFYGLNATSNFSSTNKRFVGSLVLNYDLTKSSSSMFDGLAVSPYSPLLNPDGSHIYFDGKDFPVSSSEMLIDKGYLNPARNPLEDSRLYSSTSNAKNLRSIAKIEWMPISNLKLGVSGSIKSGDIEGDTYIDQESSVTRALVNNQTVSLINNGESYKRYYIPNGGFRDVVNSKLSARSWNANFEYKIAINEKHKFSVNYSSTFSKNINKRNLDYRKYGITAYSPHGLPFLQSNSNNTNNDLNGKITGNTTALMIAPQNTLMEMNEIAMGGAIDYNFNDIFQMKYKQAYSFAPLLNQSERTYQKTLSESIFMDFDISKSLINRDFLNRKIINDIGISVDLRHTVLPVEEVYSLKGTRFIESYLGNTKPFYSINLMNINNTSVIDDKLYNASVSLRGQLFNVINFRILKSFEKNNNGGFAGNLSFSKTIKNNFINLIMFDYSKVLMSPSSAYDQILTASASATGIGISNDLSVKPPLIDDQSALFGMELFRKRIELSARFYHRRSEGLLLSTGIPIDPTTASRTDRSYGTIVNKGVVSTVKFKFLERNTTRDFGWTTSISAAHNRDITEDRPLWFGAQGSDLLDPVRRVGYSTSSVFSFSWAGLDNMGNPQIHDINNNVISYTSLSSSLTEDKVKVVYSGDGRAKWSGFMVNNIDYKNLFTSIRLSYDFGSVFRQYIPVLKAQLTDFNYNELITTRWKEAGDELHTDVPGIGMPNSNRTLIAQRSNNSILPGDVIRLQEIQVGYDFNTKKINMPLVKSLSVSMQIQNLGLWTKNKYNLDPRTLGRYGDIIMPKRPIEYSFSLNATF